MFSITVHARRGFADPVTFSCLSLPGSHATLIPPRSRRTGESPPMLTVTTAQMCFVWAGYREDRIRFALLVFWA